MNLSEFEVVLRHLADEELTQFADGVIKVGEPHEQHPEIYTVLIALWCLARLEEVRRRQPLELMTVEELDTLATLAKDQLGTSKMQVVEEVELEAVTGIEDVELPEPYLGIEQPSPWPPAVQEVWSELLIAVNDERKRRDKARVEIR